LKDPGARLAPKRKTKGRTWEPLFGGFRRDDPQSHKRERSRRYGASRTDSFPPHLKRSMGREKGSSIRGKLGASQIAAQARIKTGRTPKRKKWGNPNGTVQIFVAKRVQKKKKKRRSDTLQCTLFLRTDDQRMQESWESGRNVAKKGKANGKKEDKK